MNMVKSLCCLLLFVTIILGCAVFYSEQPLSEQLLSDLIIAEIDRHVDVDGGETQINIAELTNFEWDKMVVFRDPVSQAQISNAIGVDFTGNLNHRNGIIFVRNGEIVYEEMFPEPVSDPEPFYFFVRGENSQPRLRVHTPENAILTGRLLIRNDSNHYVVISD